MPLIYVEPLDNEGLVCQCGKPVDDRSVLHDDEGRPYFGLCRKCLEKRSIWESIVGVQG